MTLVAKRLVPGTTLQQLARDAGGVAEMPRARNVRVQQQASAGWTFGQRAQVDAVLLPSATQRAQVVRQLIFVNTPFAYVLTLVTPQEQSQARLRDLDDTASGLVPLGLTGAGDAGPSSSSGASSSRWSRECCCSPGQWVGSRHASASSCGLAERRPVIGFLRQTLGLQVFSVDPVAPHLKRNLDGRMRRKASGRL
jgi:hypothetical protein